MIEFCGKRREIEENLWSVFTSFGFDEIKYTDNLFDEMDTEKGKFCWFAEGKCGCINSMNGTARAKAEAVAICVESAVACGLGDFKIKLSDIAVLSLLVNFGFENMIEEDEEIDGFVGVSDGIEFAKGCFKEDRCCCKFDTVNFEKVLSGERFNEYSGSKNLIFAEADAEGAAYDVAYTLRINGCIVEFYNGEGSIDDAEEYANTKKHESLIRVFKDGKIMIKDYLKDEIIETSLNEFLGYYEEDECDCGHDHCDCGHHHDMGQ